MGPTSATSVFTSLAVFSTLHLASAQKPVVPNPDTIPTPWQYIGCWTDVGRTINAAFLGSADNMTIQNCINYCDAGGFSYAGTEYHSECYCGSQLAKAAKEATDQSDCNTACSGNSTQACGGPNRLSLYFNQYAHGPEPNAGIPDWPHIGCYAEGTTGRTLRYGADVPSSQMNAANCTRACFAAGYILAGVEYAGECYCDNEIANGGVPADDGCDMTCNGNKTEICGGGNRLNVFDYKMQYPISLSSSSSSVASTTSSAAPPQNTESEVVTTSSIPPTNSDPPTTPETSATNPGTDVPSSTTTSIVPATPTATSQPNVVDNYIWYGCKTEATGARALNMFTYADDTMTLESCRAFCDGKGTTFFGTEYGRECYCGNSFQKGSVDAPASDCSQICAGNKWEFCGNGNRLSVYAKNGTSVPSSSSVVTPPQTSTSSAGPTAPTGLPTGWSYQGCWQDGPNGRILTNQLQDTPLMTQQYCAQQCFDQGFTVSGTEYFTQCFCGNDVRNGGHRGDDETKCNTPCGGNNQQMCGGPGYLSIVSKGPPKTFAPPAPQLDGLNGTWTYQGCIEDNLNDKRTLPWQLYFPGTMTPELCLGQCAEFGYAAAGLEYGEECYCGDPIDVTTAGATVRPEAECNIVCAGNASSICGGGSRLTTYFWTGEEPLYVFNYPQGQNAGLYSNLVGGVVTPLMTMQSINGKVTFLEKSGTGAPNSTGAYELDLTQLGNFENAWRTMHVKTDIFCSAGVVLPDIGGRQLTVGGWSLDSTFGVRLYWPDGSDGVKGTRDWQEDNANLRLQDGRWYPSAMVMANGSVLVIGGEQGSNDIAVPTLEILPPTGTAPLYMDWLERTDPNNLYPFICVLPSGGIFVQYWNEARILDQVTFETIKTLPNAPGGVNDPMGGRTYPLEGTAVLLPQYAPYGDPLGVLICGGATTGGAALDNCVTIHPDAPNPTWELERMPSKRVMSCMAPLPDGTYLINNGAKQGVAGFGLADNPNLNALLYDPKKPLGSRISVMANTTVARLYHSESITLLDGRVLVTGSDPQDGKHPQEIRVEVFTPPYLYSSKPRPSFTITDKDWAYGHVANFQLGATPTGKIEVSLLGAVSSTHGNSMGARTLFPTVSCTGTACKVTAPPSAYISPPGWYQMFVLQDGIPAVGTYVRIGGDPAGLGNWPQGVDFDLPGV